MKTAYVEIASLIERLHRDYLDVIKAELDRLGVDDINNVQALILYNIGDDELTVGELTQRGCYLGTNVTYNLKKLIDADYVTQQRSPRDRRSVRVRLSKRGTDLFKRMDRIFADHAEALSRELGEGELRRLKTALQSLERFWDAALAGSSLTTRRTRDAA